MMVYIAGIQERDDMAFNANYTPENFQKVKALEGHQYDYAVWFGASGTVGSETPDGSFGKFSWTGDVYASLSGGGVNEAVGMSVNCTPSTPIVATFS